MIASVAGRVVGVDQQPELVAQEVISDEKKESFTANELNIETKKDTSHTDIRIMNESRLCKHRQLHGLGYVTLWHFVPDFEARENHPSIRFEDPFQIEFATSWN